MPDIKVLDSRTAELIAAGEVIERPASIVKELIENSVDAGAEFVTIEIENGGNTYIRITDNGCGIARDQVKTAFLRHATSKVSGSHDLDRIGTLGFRGEALASVCAVAKVEILTRTAEQTLGTRYITEGGKEVLFEESGMAIGTTIIVRDLFYNTPARLKFLKRESAESAAVSSIAEKLALGNPDVAIKLIRDKKQVMNTPGDGSLHSAIYSIFGSEFAAGLTDVDYELNGMSVRGFVNKPENCRPNRSMQHFFVNSRYVKSASMAAALEETYRGTIMSGRFPGCVLSLSMPTDAVDVNVHPAKIEVRFSNEREVYDTVYYAVKQGLARESTPVMSDFKPEIIPSEPQYVPEQILLKDIIGKPEKISGMKVKSEEYDYPIKPVSHNQRIIYENPSPVPEVEQAQDGPPVPEAQDIPPVPQVAQSQDDRSVSEVAVKEEIRVIGELFGTFIAGQAGRQMFLIDKHAAHERIIYERIKDSASPLDRQILIIPENIVLSGEEYEAIISNQNLVNDCGFAFEQGSGRQLLITEIPAILGNERAGVLFAELASDIIRLKKEPARNALDKLLYSIACRAAVKAHDITSLPELISIAESVLCHDTIRYCPHGRPVVITFTEEKLAKMFKRM
ncbi:MAG: DNA mismatch repair endonuclease MutL [Oscillospiraceae bacterium]|nr:DNA mismatch repair endonuclease MutL [Oscillospiraceae bacterium]